MGEVYRARDERLGRDVAIKALPAAFAQDPERLARFEREAKLLATLNHPNIATIYGLEEAEGSRYLVLELVEGETLAARLERGVLPLNESLDVCRQVAAAVEIAHETGIIHRDLKPGNVMLSASGAVKVLDFGLAKAAADSSSDPNLSESPTLTHAAAGTADGVILGTAAYMSPEQARGKPVDKRTDIWSFGCVLYECLTGRQCFTGETVSDLIAQILQSEPDWDGLPSKVPTRLRQLLRRCLEKDERRRLRDIGDARIELEDVIAQSTSSSTIVATRQAAAGSLSRVRLIAFGAVLVVASVLATIGVWSGLHPTSPRTPVRFEVADAENMTIGTDGSNAAISPDGKMLVFGASDSISSKLWVRSLETLTATPLAGTEEGYQPFWSPDSRYISFFSFGKLKRVPAAGGAVEELCETGFARGGSWNKQGVILFAPTSGPLFRLSASGGDPEQITTLDSTSGETAHRFPQFLPDGRHYLYTSLPPKEGKFDIYVGQLDSPKREFLLSASSGALYAEPGYLLYQHNGSLVVQQFDASSRRLRATPVTLRESMALTGFSGGPGFSVSANGTLAYTTLRLPDARLAWFDMAGHQIADVPIDPAPYVDMEISPDGRRLALVRSVSGSKSEIWIGDLERGVATRFSQEPFSCENPEWSPDGTRIAYSVTDQGPQWFVIRAVVGTSEPRTLLKSDPTFKNLSGWSPDGRFLIYASQDPETRHDLWVLPVEGNQEPQLYLKTPFIQLGGHLSGDGRWMAYQSNESGRFEGYVQPYPTPGIKYQVTKGGGFVAGWLDDGKQLAFWLSSNPTTVKVADVIPGEEFRLGPTRTLCVLPRDQLETRLADDGKRLLSLLPAGKPAANSITVVLDWAEGLERN
jgi:serine/threonine protein kinase